jgi:hypothetical protein
MNMRGQTPRSQARASASARRTAAGLVDCGVRRAATAASGVIAASTPASKRAS